jgi:hypothetical protein
MEALNEICTLSSLIPLVAVVDTCCCERRSMPDTPRPLGEQLDAPRLVDASHNLDLLVRNERL